MTGGGSEDDAEQLGHVGLVVATADEALAAVGAGG